MSNSNAPSPLIQLPDFKPQRSMISLSTDHCRTDTQ